MYKRKVIIVRIILVLLFIILWELLSSLGVINKFIFSSPSSILVTTIDLFKSYNLLSHITMTLFEIGISFILSMTIALIGSIILYTNKFLSDTVRPFLTMLNSLPKVSLGPIIIIWCGANIKSIILMAVLTSSITGIITIYNSFINTDYTYIKLFKSMHASKKDILFKLIIPYNKDTILNYANINISLTLIGVIMGELLVSKKGLGYLIEYGTQIFNLNIVMSSLMILSIISYILYKLNPKN